MKNFGLIGKSLGHSFSKQFFDQHFENETSSGKMSYNNIELERIEDLSDVLKRSPLEGFNVTIPYKQAIIPFLSQISIEAAEVNAVNCVVIEKGLLKGYNTDLPAFLHTYSDLFDQRYRAMILGTGASSSMVAFALRSLGIESIKVGRDKSADIQYTDLNAETITDHQIIINTTPLGTYPDTDQFPDIPYAGITADHRCIDLIYNPEETVFLKKCREQGATTRNGQTMLEKQALLSYELWQISRHN